MVENESYKIIMSKGLNIYTESTNPDIKTVNTFNHKI